MEATVTEPTVTQPTVEVEAIGFWAEAARHPDKSAVITAAGEVTTYGELATRTNRIANLLHDRGLRAGDHLAFLLGNQVTTYEVALACVQLGVIYTPINRSLTGSEAAYILQDSGARAFVAQEDYAEAAVAAAQQAPAAVGIRLSIGNVPGFEELSGAAGGYPDSLPPRGPAGGPFYYTSGTTGRPKGVFRSVLGTLSLTEALSAFIKVAAVNGCTPEGVYLVQGPLHHSGPLGSSLNVLHAGATVILMSRWDAQTCLELIERYRVCATLMVPTMFHRLLALPPEVRQRYDVGSLRTGLVKHGSALCPVSVKRAMIDWFGPVLLETYGGQEGVIATVNSVDWLAHPGTVGRVDRVPVRILDDEGNVCDTGVVGNIYAALGDVEYYHAPDKTAASRRGQFFTLGDIGYIDPDGWLYLVDRRVDLIISGGVNIYPAEVEAALLQHPAVGDVAVIGIPNDEWGHEVKAIVQTSVGYPASDALGAELIDFCRAQIAKYKCPRTVDFLETLPRDPLGKLQRWQLRQAYPG
jgi:long-chain acyl-CoA synthetase